MEANTAFGFYKCYLNTKNREPKVGEREKWMEEVVRGVIHSPNMPLGLSWMPAMSTQSQDAAYIMKSGLCYSSKQKECTYVAGRVSTYTPLLMTETLWIVLWEQIIVLFSFTSMIDEENWRF